MKGEETPSYLVRISRFAAGYPSLDLGGSGARTFDRRLPVLILDEGVELGRTQVVIGLGLVLVRRSYSGGGVGGCCGSIGDGGGYGGYVVTSVDGRGSSRALCA